MSASGGAGRGRVVVVGSINADWIVEVSRLPSAGQTVVGGGVSRHHGGKGANQAVAAARAEADVVMVGAVGDDELAEAEIAALEDAGVDAGAVERIAGAATGLAMITVDVDGENQITVAPGANTSLDVARIDRQVASLALGRCDVVLVSNELAAATVAAAIAAGAEAGARTVLNPAPARSPAPEAWPRISLLTPNEPEARSLAGARDVGAAARSLAARIGGPVIVTRGASGAMIVGDRERDAPVHVPAPKCSPVDTVGAGDVFNGVLCARLSAGDSLDAATVQAVASATESTRFAGARQPSET